MPQIAITVTLRALPGKRDELIEQCRAFVPPFIEQREVLRIELLLPPDDPDTLVLWEVYESEEALALHRSGELLKNFRSSVGGLLQGLSSTQHMMLE